MSHINYNKPYILIAFFTLLFSCSTAMAKNSDSKTYTETFTSAPGDSLKLHTDAGSIKINTHTSNTIELSVKVSNDHDEEFSFRHEKQGGNLIIIGEINTENRWIRNLRVEFELTVPIQHELTLKTSGGSIEVADLRGNLHARTSGGSIEIGNIEGDVYLYTSGGSINTDSINGNLNAHTSGGSVNVSITKQPSHDAKISTSGGSIKAYLPADVQLDIAASTSGGRVKSDFLVDGRVKKQSLIGQINGGGPKLTLSTSGGNIKIKKL